jgi:hypothetical protein
MNIPAQEYLKFSGRGNLPSFAHCPEAALQGKPFH